MKKHFVCAIIVAGLFLAGVCPADSLKAIQKQGVLRIATEGSFAPFNYFNGGELTGFEVELGNEIAKRLNLNPVWKALSFDSLLIGLNQNRYDIVIASHAITPERSQVVDFVRPHYCSGGVIVTLVGGPQKKSELQGKVVAAQVGSIYPPFLEKNFPGIKEIKTFPKNSDSVQSLLSRKVDAAIIDRFEAVQTLKANPGKDLVIGEVINDEKIGMAVNKGNTELKDIVERKLLEIMKDGTYSRLSQKYLGQDIRCEQ